MLRQMGFNQFVESIYGEDDDRLEEHAERYFGRRNYKGDIKNFLAYLYVLSSSNTIIKLIGSVVWLPKGASFIQ